MLKFIADGELTKAPLVMCMDEDDWTDEDGAGVGWGFTAYPSEDELLAFGAAYVGVCGGGGGGRREREREGRRTLSLTFAQTWPSPSLLPLSRYDVVLMDPAMRLNMMSRVSKHGAESLRREASASLLLLQAEGDASTADAEAFDALFLRKASQWGEGWVETRVSGARVGSKGESVGRGLGRNASQ